MPPIRRYLRITKHSALECRIFLENPADGTRWLLSPKDPALPRVFEAVKPLVLPKLREENERSKGKGKKKKAVKDVVVKDDFEVSVFLTDVGTRHALVVKNKTFTSTDQNTSNTKADPVVLREESDEEELSHIPLASEGGRRHETAEEDKKKLAFSTTYNGFAIWGKVLCLLVARKGGPANKGEGPSDGQALMQEWITATQMQLDDEG